jgi:succinyldiaminopimelate transaminase
VTTLRPATGFVPPPYPYDRLDALKPLATGLAGGLVDLSIGTPTDPAPEAAVAALSGSGTERGYPPSIGTPALREAASAWMARRLGVEVPPSAVAAAVGTKEFVASLPQYLHLRWPDRDTVLYPAASYPTYEMGAILAGCRAVPVPVDDAWRVRLDAIDPADADRALCLWVNSPANPTGALDDLAAAARWGRERNIAVFSDECYVEFTWDAERDTILRAGLDGLVAVHSLSKRSNFAGARVGFYAGDPELVAYLQEVRKHVGLMVPGPVQVAGAIALGNDAHVDAQRERYRRRLEMAARLFAHLGIDAPLPHGGFYLWVPAPGGDAWGLTERLVREAGVLVSPGEFYGETGKGHVRVAVVQPDAQLEMALARVGA